jgi:hypothetical protein
MPAPVTTCTDIELAVLTELTTKIEGIRAAANQKDQVGLYPGPTVSVAIFEGAFEKVTQATWKQKVTVHVLLTFKHERGEEERRRGINPLVQGVVQTLMLRDLGLAMEALKPVRFREVTDADDYEARAIVYLVEFSTSFNLTRLDDEAAGDLLKVGLNYYLQPGDDVVDASDLVERDGP